MDGPSDSPQAQSLPVDVVSRPFASVRPYRRFEVDELCRRAILVGGRESSQRRRGCISSNAREGLFCGRECGGWQDVGVQAIPNEGVEDLEDDVHDERRGEGCAKASGSNGVANVSKVQFNQDSNCRQHEA
jgi:hypothetical protein